MAVDTPAAAPSPTATLRRRAVRGGAIYLAARLAAQLFQWSVTLGVARLLLPDDYGLMTAGMLFVGLADMLAEAGVGKALVQKKQLDGADLAQGFTLSLLLSTALYALLFVVADPAAGYLGRPEFAPFLRVLALLLFLVPFQSSAVALLERDLHLGKQSAVHLGGAVAQSALVLALALAGMGYWALAAGSLAGKLLQTAFVGYASGWRPALAWPATEAWGLLRYGMHVSGAGLLWFAYSNSDFAAAGALLGPIMLGYYALAFQLVSLPVQKISAHVNQIMFPVFCRLQDDRARARDWFLRLTVLVAAVTTPALVGMALVADDGLPLLLGERWRPAVLPLQMLCPIGAPMVLAAALLQMIGALGRPDVNLKYTAFSALLYPAAFFAAGSWLGIEGICLVWLVLYPVQVAALVHLTRGLTGIPLSSLLRAHAPVIAGTGFMAGCVLLVQAVLPDAEPVARLAAAICAGIAAYLGWLLLAARSGVLADVRGLWRELRGR